jgi:hypothetical protein
VSLLLLLLLKSFSGLEYGKYNFLQELLVINCKTQEKKRIKSFSVSQSAARSRRARRVLDCRKLKDENLSKIKSK